MISDIIARMKQQKADTMWFRLRFGGNEDYFTLFTSKEGRILEDNIVWINDVHELFNTFDLKYDLDLLFNGEKISLEV